VSDWLLAPFPWDEEERLQRLERLGLRPEQQHDFLDHVAALAASIVGAPIALVSIVARDAQWFAARHGLETPGTGRSESFCGHAVTGSTAFVVPDASADPRFTGNPLVRGPPGIRAYLGVPLFAGPGQSGIGTLCVIDPRPRRYTEEHERELYRLSALVERYLEDLAVRRAWESSPLSMVNVDRDGRCLRVNLAFARMLGRDRDSILGRPLRDFLLPTDRGVLSAMIAQALSRAESPTRRELRFTRLSGEVVLGGVSVSASVPTDQAICVIRDISLERRSTGRASVIADVRRELTAPLERARARLSEVDDRASDALRADLDEFESLVDARIGDITARTRAEADILASEQRLRAVLEHAVGMLLVLDDRGRIVDANARALTALGWRYDELVGESMSRIEPAFSDATLRRWSAPAVAPPACDPGIETAPAVFVARGGQELRVELGAMLMDWNGPGRIVVLARDVSATFAREARLVQQRDDLAGRDAANREVIEALRRLESELKASLLEKDVLLKEIHHRVKNNLQIVISLLSLQMGKVQDPASRDMLVESAQRVRSMAMIHQHLYGTASLERIEIGAYARRLAESLAGTLAPDARLRVEAAPVEIDVQRAAPVGLVLNELLTNAFKYGRPVPPSDGPTAELLVELGIARDGPLVRLVVRDGGPGLPAGFDLKQSRSLGLHLVRALSRQLRGRVTARSDGGAVFELEFPM
jgi:PAS domain S-box-containing protein